MAARSDYDEKTITVLDSVVDVETVLARYKKKGWEAVSHARFSADPPSIKLTLRRPKQSVD